VLAKIKKMEKKEFSIEEGQKVQAENLKFWETVLKKKYYDKLIVQVVCLQLDIDKRLKENNRLKTGYDIVRGSDISSIVHHITSRFSN
jgi:hypothetical protein